MPIQGYIQAPYSSSLGGIPITQASWLDTAHVGTHASGIDAAAIDFGLPRGKDVLSMAPGIVIGVYSSADENNFNPVAAAAAGNDMGPKGFGNIVTIFHYIDRVDSSLPYYFVATYSHLAADSVSSIATAFANLEEGEQLFVEAGTNLGKVGTSGYSYGSVGHLHVNFGVIATTDNLLASGYPLDSESPYPNANENLLNFLGFDAGHYIDGEGNISPIPLAELQGDIPVFSYVTSYNTDTGEPPSVGSGSGYGGSGGVDGPDLVGTDLDIDGSSFDVGDTLDFVLDISNIGDLNSGEFSVSFYITEEQSLDNAVYLFSEDDLFSLSPGETDFWDYFAYTNGTWHSGNYYLAAVIDSNDDVDESDETNNIIYEQFYLNGIDPTADVAFSGYSSGTGNRTLERSGTFSTYFEVTNSNFGKTDFGRSTSAQIVFSTDQNISIDDIFLGDFRIPDLSVGEKEVFTNATVSLPDDMPLGDYYVAVILDPADLIDEVYEDNNSAWYTHTFEVVEASADLPDVAANSIGCSTSNPQTGDSVTISWTVTNQEGASTTVSFTTGVYISTDTNVTTSDRLLISDVASAGLAAGGEQSFSGTIVFDDTFAPGEYWIAAIADTGNTITEADETNNAIVHGYNFTIDPALAGGDGDETLTGGSGNDTIHAGAGNDLVRGGSGNDVLNGGLGNDTLNGGQDGDTYVVDDIGDVIIESRNWTGIDTVEASFDFRMGNRHIENLELTGTAILGAGNGLRNLITGNDQDNTLDGGKNTDTLVGGLGNDRYLLRAPGDNAVEEVNGGIDTVLAFRSIALDANVENLFIQTLRNAAGQGIQGVNGIGNELNNTIVGNPFDNFIIGREGRDTLKGQAGADTFVFDRQIGTNNVDRIIDFNVNTAAEGDRLYLKGSIFGGLTGGTLNGALFHLGTAAGNGNHRIIFDQASGQLWFDGDGNGTAQAQQLVATFEQNATVGAGDIFIF